MKKGYKSILWISIGVILFVLIAIPKIIDSKEKNKDNKQKGNKQQLALVKTLVINPSLLRELVKTSGTLLADEEIDLTFEASGKIEKIFFKEGGPIQKGQLLAKLTDDDLKAQMSKLQLQNKLLDEKVNRQKVLLEKEAISQESFDQMMTDLQSNEAEIKLLQVRIDETEIRAPFSGIIGLRYISEGAYVNPTTRIAKLIKTQPLKIEFSIPERYSEIVKNGYELFFYIENNPQTFKARVYALEPTVDPKTRTLTLRALYDNPGNKLNPGRFVSIELITREKNNALQVPTEAIIPELGGEKVFVVKNGVAVSTIVKTGLRTDNAIEIIKGLNPGDSVVVSGIMQLRSDMPVKVINN